MLKLIMNSPLSRHQSAVIEFLLAMNKRSKSTLPYYNSDDSTEYLEFFQKFFVTSCKCNEIDDKTVNIYADLENQLRRSEMDLMLANEKIAIYDDKIKDKNDIIEGLKMINNLLKSENKEKFDFQTVATKKIEELLQQKNHENVQTMKYVQERTNEFSENSAIERLQRNIDNLEIKVKSYQDKEEDYKKLIASLEAQIKEKDNHITLLELGQNLDTLKLKEMDALLREQAATIKPKRFSNITEKMRFYSNTFNNSNK